VQTLSQPGADGWQAEVAIDPAGNAVFVWERFDGATALVQARTRSVTGVVDSVRTLASSAEDGTAPAVAVDADSNVIIVWGANDGAAWSVHAATGSLP
jgi:hypothetical protein